MFTIALSVTNIFADQSTFKKDSIVNKFYATIHKNVYWFQASNDLFSSVRNWFAGNNKERIKQWIAVLDSADKFGTSIDKEQIQRVRAVALSNPPANTAIQASADTLLSSLVLHFIKEYQQGNCRFDYDGVSVNRDSLYISQLLRFRFLNSVSQIVAELECKDPEYAIYKKFLHDSLLTTDSTKRKTLLCAMNYRRFLSVNCQSEYVLVNIPQAEAAYYKENSLAIKMRVVAGKKNKQTPTIASYIPSITTFPNWNVPYQVAVDEILPKVQKDENYLEQNNYTVVDANGDEVDDSNLNWNDFNTTNFTYFIRQSSGSENVLGVVKFDLQDPFSIFLHGTSNQKTFSRDYRFLSHGCIRLEKPFALADSLLRGKIDIAELKTGKTDKNPTIIQLKSKVQAFIIYMPVQIEGNQVTFLKDEYGLIK